ncbi:MAG: glycosyltransferase family 2 protein [Clostridium septicum]|uniref:glycosyltransferase n=1 Tax=Clostridium septicum TaxID=1504 RepID=UPI00258B0818|nr:glycosyltransferase family 2 protein [Clostridium septicum]MDU1312962.1 glycosyltransferase family 2 protein [Clostridium septicum]
MRILVAILNFHQSDLLIDLIDNIKYQSVNNIIDIVIGDVQPKEEEKDEILKYISLCDDVKNIKYIEIDENLGYAKGNNLIIKEMSNHYKYDYVVISNPDITIKDENLIENMILNLNKYDDCAVIGPKVKTPQGRQQGPYNKQVAIKYCLKYFFPVFWYPFWKYRENKITKYKEIRKVWRLIGAFMIVKMSDFERVKMFDENTFLYWEEEILSYKLLQINKYVYFDPNSEVLHLHGSNGKSTISKYDTDSMKYYFKLIGCTDFTVKMCENSVNFYNRICKILGRN